MNGLTGNEAEVMRNVCKDFKVLNRHEGLKGSIKDLFSRDYKTVSAVKDVTMTVNKGEIIGYKKAWVNYCGVRYYVIVTLRIPADARRSSGTGRKCRCDKAIVEKIEWISAGPSINPSIAHSIHNHDFHYVVGRVVQPTNGFCEDRWKTCAGGIHFFMNKQEAIDY